MPMTTQIILRITLKRQKMNLFGYLHTLLAQRVRIFTISTCSSFHSWIYPDMMNNIYTYNVKWDIDFTTYLQISRFYSYHHIYIDFDSRSSEKKNYFDDSSSTITTSKLSHSIDCDSVSSLLFSSSYFSSTYSSSLSNKSSVTTYHYHKEISLERSHDSSPSLQRPMYHDIVTVTLPTVPIASIINLDRQGSSQSNVTENVHDSFVLWWFHQWW